MGDISFLSFDRGFISPTVHLEFLYIKTFLPVLLGDFSDTDVSIVNARPTVGRVKPRLELHILCAHDFIMIPYGLDLV